MLKLSEQDEVIAETSVASPVPWREGHQAGWTEARNEAQECLKMHYLALQPVHDGSDAAAGCMSHQSDYGTLPEPSGSGQASLEAFLQVCDFVEPLQIPFS
ncbi:hypothetical protein AOLI_G00191550 [Acnodon oligacanthus]